MPSPSIACGADTLRNSMSLNLDYKRQDWVCPNASASNLRGLGGAKTRGNLEQSEALLREVSARRAGAVSGEDRPPFALPLAENRTLIVLLWTREIRGGGSGMLLPSEIPSSPSPSLHIKTEYSPRLAAFGVPPAAARKEASCSRRPNLFLWRWECAVYPSVMPSP